MLPNIDKLSLTQQVAQMLVVRASGYLFDHQIQYPDWETSTAKLINWVQNLGIGGIIFVGASAGEIAIRTSQLQSRAKIPLLMAADIEEGVGQRFSGATWFPPPMALSAIFRQNSKLGVYYAEQMGIFTAQEALGIGINWVLAPVVDVNNNPNNPVINVRAFGETTDEVKELACAFIRGVNKYPILTTAKHFPGHGDTEVDSHLELPKISHSESHLAEVELPPFLAAIDSGADMVMAAHLLIPSWDDRFPATLSHKILTGKLRQELGFSGLITTDALVMGAITNYYEPNEAPVMAVEAGADILLMTVDPEGAINAICKAVENGRITPLQIRESVERIWRAKEKTAQNRMDVISSTQLVGTPEARMTVKEIVQHSLITNISLNLSPTKFINSTPANNFPSNKTFTELRNLIVVDNPLKCPHINHMAPAVDLPEKMGYHTQICDHEYFQTINLQGDFPTLLQLFIRGNPFNGSASFNETAIDFLKGVLTNKGLQAFVVYGSPYVWRQFIPLMNVNTPGVFSYGQMPIAQEVALLYLFGS
ncbi:glycoside hydrolase family 3 protein [Richelia intracellularis]|nr:glycoside hydrolase family 3 N-terminal domain-containing protein [Richelia intracellularis]HAE05689.1 beta-glucosidase [Richelia sp.]